MSPINSALQYKIQKMERQLSSLMEENRALRTIINEAGPALYGGGGSYSGAAHGAALAQGQAASDAYLGNYTGLQASGAQYGGGGVAASRSSRRSSGGPGVAASQVAPGGGGQPPFDGAMLGNLLAQAGQDGGAAAANYLAQYGVNIPSVTGAQTASDRRRTNPLATRR